MPVIYIGQNRSIGLDGSLVIAPGCEIYYNHSSRDPNKRYLVRVGLELMPPQDVDGCRVFPKSPQLVLTKDG
jgi:hypothetical protein